MIANTGGSLRNNYCPYDGEGRKIKEKPCGTIYDQYNQKYDLHLSRTVSDQSISLSRSIWRDWSVSRKRSKNNLEEMLDIDPIVQHHMTIPSNVINKQIKSPPVKQQRLKQEITDANDAALTKQLNDLNLSSKVIHPKKSMMKHPTNHLSCQNSRSNNSIISQKDTSWDHFLAMAGSQNAVTVRSSKRVQY